MSHLSSRKRARLLATVLGGALACAALPALAGPVAYPAEVADKLAALSPDQRAFITESTSLERLGLTADQIALGLAARPVQEAGAYVSALMQVVADARFDPATDNAELPLNPGATAFNAPTTLKPALFDEYRRAPGPFSLARYMYQPSGIPSFAQAPVALRKEDLLAGKVEVAFMGIPLDMSSGIRDAKHGPMALRAADGLVGTDVYTGLDPAKLLRMADYGNINVDNMSSERTIGHVREMVAEVASTGAVPFIVGGDHTLMYPDVAAMVDTYGKGKVGVLQLDAHYEGQAEHDHFISDHQSVQRLIGDGLLSGKDIVQVGLRGTTMSSADLARFKALGVRMHSMADIEKEGWQAVAEKALAQVRSGPQYLFISFDMSVLDSAYAPGAGRPVPNGLTMREAVPLVRMLCAQNNVVGFELLDPAPIIDTSYKTAQNANYIMHSCLAGMAKRKADNIAKTGK